MALRLWLLIVFSVWPCLAAPAVVPGAQGSTCLAGRLLAVGRFRLVSLVLAYAGG